MRTIFLIFFAIILISNVYADCSLNTPLKYSSICNVENIYSGNIGDFEIQMKFKIDEQNNIDGSYHYIKHKIPIPIKGHLDRGGHFTINEYGEPEKLTGVFDGIFLNLGIMKGEWHNPDGDRSYPFKIECKKVFQFCSDDFSENTGFRIIREYINDEKSLVKILINNKKEIVLAEEEDYSCIDVFSVEVQKLTGKPNLFYIKWSTIPEGNGGYTSFYHILIAEGSDRILLKKCHGQGRASWCDHGLSEFSLQYKANAILILEHNSYRYCSGMNKDGDYEHITEGEETVNLTYKINNKGVELVKAEKYERSVSGNQENFDNLSSLLEKKKWNKSVIPIESAKLKYPAIDNNTD